MIKFIAAMVFLATVCLGSNGYSAEAFYDWSFKGNLTDSARKQGLKVLDESNKPVSGGVEYVEDNKAGKVVRLDGKAFLSTVYRNTGDQTYYLKVKFTAAPKGVLISKNRPSPKLRGIECGLASKKFYEFDGNKPAAMVSAGSKDTICALFSPGFEGLKSDVWYGVYLVFKGGEYLQLVVVDCDTSAVVYNKRINAEKVKKLSVVAGEKLLNIGGRRLHSKKSHMLLSAGTLLARATVWSVALDDKQISTHAAVKDLRVKKK